MTGLTRVFSLAVLGMIMATPSGYAGEIDRSAVDFKTPSDIKWVRNAAGTSRPCCSATPASRAPTSCASNGCRVT